MAETQEKARVSYRPDIDGLRAISVIGVILYHFKLGAPGGFVGVDVFFVISGYLITSIILRELGAGSFSLANFWARRIRRILPAATAVTVFTLFAGVFILTPADLTSLAKSSIANSLIASNFFFWRDAGYFTEAADLKPLLHTWSLSVEEQFYLFLPLTLYVLFRFVPARIQLFVGLGILLSLSLSTVGTQEFPGATFYLLPTRAWELLAGALAATLIWADRKPSPRIAPTLSIAGIIGIIAPMFFYNSSTPFPGPAAIPPVVGAVFVLYANAENTTAVGKILSVRPLVFTGLLSYSLYLWHWPILAFSHHILIEHTALSTLILLALTAIASYASWRWIETPFRYSKRLETNGRSFLFAALTTAVLVVAATAYLSLQGIPQRFSEETIALIQDTEWTGSEFKEHANEPIGTKRLGDRTKPTSDFVLWGDSHALVLTHQVNEISKDLGIAGTAFITPATPPVPGLWMPDEPFHDSEGVLAMNERRLAWIREQRVKHVILAGRWSAMMGGHFGEPTAIGIDSPSRLMVVDRKSLNPLPENSSAAMKRKLKDLSDSLKEFDSHLWILPQVPEIHLENPAKIFELSRRFPSLNSELPKSGITLREHQQRQKLPANVFTSLQDENLTIIDSVPSFFPNFENQLEWFGDRSFYRDDNHLTKAGVERYLKNSLKSILKEIAATGTTSTN